MTDEVMDVVVNFADGSGRTFYSVLDYTYDDDKLMFVIHQIYGHKVCLPREAVFCIYSRKHQEKERSWGD